MARNSLQLIKDIREDLGDLGKFASQQYKKALSQLNALRKSKELIKHKSGKYTMNPRRFGRLNPEEVGKEYRKRAQETKRKVHIEFDNLLQSKRVIQNGALEISRSADLVIKNLASMNEGAEYLSKWMGYLENRVKLFNYERRKEIELFNEVSGKGPAKSSKRKVTTKGQIGDVKMAKKDKRSVKELLDRLGKAKDQDEKRQIRVELRSLGHKGGLGTGRGRPKVKKTKKSKKKAAKK